MSFADMAIAEKDLVDMGVAYFVDKTLGLDPRAVVAISDFVTLPPRTFIGTTNRLGKVATINSGLHKADVFLHEAVEHSQRRRQVFGEEHPWRNIMAEVIEFSGPTIDTDSYCMNVHGGRKLTLDDTQGVGLSFIACSYDYNQKKMISADGIDAVTWRLEEQFAEFMTVITGYARAQGCERPVVNPQPVRNEAKILRKAFG